MYSRLFVGLNVIALIVVIAVSPRWIDPLGKPVGTDFIGFWAAGHMALQGHAVDAYDADRHYEAERGALPWRGDERPPQVPWLYPPTFLMLAAGLALLPYGLALGVWLTATLPLYVLAVREILPGMTTVMVALAFPAVFSNLAHGQTGFLAAGLFGGALLLLETRPWAAGILFGLLAYKPQFGVLVPLALMAGGYWRTICAAGLSMAGTISLSWRVWGTEPWRAFFEAMREAGVFGLEEGAIGFEKLQSVYAGARMLGLGSDAAWVLQAAVAVLVAALVVWVWLKPGLSTRRYAVLCIASLMVTPYVFDYDLIILALPLAWLAAEGLREGFGRWEKLALLAAWLLPLLSRMIGRYLHAPSAPLVLGALLYIGLRTHRGGSLRRRRPD